MSTLMRSVEKSDTRSELIFSNRRWTETGNDSSNYCNEVETFVLSDRS